MVMIWMIAGKGQAFDGWYEAAFLPPVFFNGASSDYARLVAADVIGCLAIG